MSFVLYDAFSPFYNPKHLQCIQVNVRTWVSCHEWFWTLFTRKFLKALKKKWTRNKGSPGVEWWWGATKGVEQFCHPSCLAPREICPRSPSGMPLLRVPTLWTSDRNRLWNLYLSNLPPRQVSVLSWRDCSSVVEHILCMKNGPVSIPGISKEGKERFLSVTLENYCQSESTLWNWKDQWSKSICNSFPRAWFQFQPNPNYLACCQIHWSAWLFYSAGWWFLEPSKRAQFKG